MNQSSIPFRQPTDWQTLHPLTGWAVNRPNDRPADTKSAIYRPSDRITDIKSEICRQKKKKKKKKRETDTKSTVYRPTDRPTDTKSTIYRPTDRPIDNKSTIYRPTDRPTDTKSVTYRPTDRPADNEWAIYRSTDRANNKSAIYSADWPIIAQQVKNLPGDWPNNRRPVSEVPMKNLDCSNWSITCMRGGASLRMKPKSGFRFSLMRITWFM